jgi:hypothetical protein
MVMFEGLILIAAAAGLARLAAMAFLDCGERSAITGPDASENRDRESREVVHEYMKRLPKPRVLRPVKYSERYTVPFVDETPNAGTCTRSFLSLRMRPRMCMCEHMWVLYNRVWIA